MIGLDTNILVRYFTEDDPVQSRRAKDCIESRLTEDHPGFVSLVTIVELVWVLGGAYGMIDGAIATVVERMLQATTLVLQSEQQVFEAMIALKTSKGEFADALIGALASHAGCGSTLTLDKKAARLPTLQLL
jgi:predicted nucleic-acid-binding protein